MNDIHVRPFRSTDKEILDIFRWQYSPADLELPKGYLGARHETAVSEKDGHIVSSLTCTMAAILDPLVNNPNMSAIELQKGLIKLEALLSYNAQKAGAADVYIAVPNGLKDYMRIVEKTGYVKTVENCTVYRRPLLPDTEELIGTVRDRLELEKSVSVPESNPEV